MIFLIKDIETLMLPCVSKKYLGIDCPGCGLQRSVSMVLKTDFTAAFFMYPAIYSLIALGLFLIISQFIVFKYSEKIKMFLVILNVAIITINYFINILY